MAGNTEKIDEIVDRSAVSAQITSTTAELRELEAALVDSLNGAVQLNQALGRAQTFRQYQQSATQAAQATAKLSEQQQKAAIAAQKLAQEEAKTAIANNRLAQSNENLRKSQERTTKANAQASSSYQQLVKEYNAAQAAARNAGASFGTSSLQFRVASQEANRLRAQLDGIDQPLGNFQRNVGNYSSAIGGFFSKAYGAIRTAANILPGLGISGIFLLGYEGIKAAAEALGLFGKEAGKAKANLQALNDINKEASKEYGDQSVKLKFLYAAATDVNNKEKDRIAAAKELQSLFPETFKNSTIQSIINGNEAQSYKDLTAQLLETARARAAANKLEEIAGQRQEIAFQKAKINSARAAELARARAGQGESSVAFSGTGAGAATASLSLKQQLVNINVRANLALKEQQQKDAILKSEEDFVTKLAGGATKIGNALISNRSFNVPKLSEDKSFDDRLAKEKELEQSILTSEQSSFQDRFAAIDTFEKNSEKIIAEGVKAKVYRVQEGANKAVAIENEAAKQRIALQKQVNAAVDAEQKAALERLKGNLAQEVLEFQDAQNQRLLEIDRERSKRASALADQYAQGKISALQYNRDLYNIDSAAAQERVKVQIAAAEATVKAQAAAVALGFGNAKDLQNSTNQLARLQIQASDLVTENELANIRKIEDARKRLKEKEKELADASITLIQTVVDAGYTNQLNALQDQSDQIDANADKEKKAIDNSNLSQQEKADKTKLLDAQVQAQKELIAQKEKKIRQDQAKFDRAVSIARVIQATAIAVAEALTVPIVGIALASVIGALGAVQLATILATPLPKYAKGTMNSPEGYAHVGEQGVEGRIDPDGTFSLTPAIDTITYLQKGTKIIPHMQLMKAMQGEKLVYVGGQSVDMSEVVKAIKDNKPQKQGNPRINGWAREMRDMEKYNNYRSKYFN